MTAPPPRRTWWRRTRTWAALALWLIVAYPLSSGPFYYCAGRGWVALDDPLLVTAYEPLLRALGGPRDSRGWSPGPPLRLWNVYNGAFADRGRGDAASD